VFLVRYEQTYISSLLGSGQGGSLKLNDRGCNIPNYAALYPTRPNTSLFCTVPERRVALTKIKAVTEKNVVV
jgi:hypothetical protein